MGPLERRQVKRNGKKEGEEPLSMSLSTRSTKKRGGTLMQAFSPGPAEKGKWGKFVLVFTFSPQAPNQKGGKWRHSPSAPHHKEKKEWTFFLLLYIRRLKNLGKVPWATVGWNVLKGKEENNRREKKREKRTVLFSTWKERESLGKDQHGHPFFPRRKGKGALREASCPETGKEKGQGGGEGRFPTS